MVRKIIKIDEEKCNGCGACADACHEGAIAMINGKAKLMREDYCDGLGDCLPQCPCGAISFEEREAAAYDKAAVLASQQKGMRGGELGQWPCQLKLVPTNAPYYQHAHLLVAADCTAFAYAQMHSSFLKDKITVIGCPKLDAVDYSEKLAAILKENDILSITVVRMEVPCCGGMVAAVEKALQKSGKQIPLQTFILSINGLVLT